MVSLQQFVIAEFQRLYRKEPTAIVRAPGRVNLIGEHTDYNDGFVLPMAIDRAIWIALEPCDERSVTIYSPHYNQSITFPLDDYDTAKSGWVEYVRGMAWSLQMKGHPLRGWKGVMSGDVPVGAGLSSSAALELATARAFSVTSGLDWVAADMAKLGQNTENHWIGVNSGIMDQMISAGGKIDHALLIDCRSLEATLVPLPQNTSIIVLDTATRRGLGDTAYNERRAQCEAAAKFFGVKALRDVSLKQFNEKSPSLDEVIRKRARHVITENERTLKAADVMRRGDAVELGLLMKASHDSLRDDYQVSSDALDTIVACALEVEGCFGARMTGGGFGGCAVALVKTPDVEKFVDNVTKQYQKITTLQPNIYVCKASNGAEVV